MLTKLVRRNRGSLEPASAARVAGLKYTLDDQPGISRVRRGQGFFYVCAKGSRVTAPQELARIRALVIPPAWTSVWICPSANGHLQATGRDARGRKQYRYHASWRMQRDETKYHRLAQFGDRLKAVRREVDRRLRLAGLAREKILAAAIRVLDLAGVRIGNAQYTESNGSFGLTTLRNRHAQIRGDTLRLQFRGKSGQVQNLAIHDGRLARLIRRCSELPGQQLLQYVDDDGRPQSIQSHEINELLRKWAGEDFTAKDFRTWTGSVAFLRFVKECDDEETVPHLIKKVSEVLGNTASVCRKYYIHPTLIEGYESGQLLSWIAKLSQDSSKHRQRWLNSCELLLLRWLHRRTK